MFLGDWYCATSLSFGVDLVWLLIEGGKRRTGKDRGWEKVGMIICESHFPAAAVPSSLVLAGDNINAP